MKACRVAALALVLGSMFGCSRKPVGWYLMTPPQATDRRGAPLVGPDFHAPLYQWQKSKMGENGKQFELFDSKQASGHYSTLALPHAQKRLVGAPPSIDASPSQ